MQQQQIVQLIGGLDLVTPSVAIPEGRAIAALNHECEARGYRRVEGYERFDGQPKPSKASYWILTFDAGSTEIAVDDVVTGGTSGATGIVLAVVLTSGTWGGGDAAGQIVLYNVTGTFQDNEALQVSASTVATSAGAALENGADTDALNTTYRQAAIAARRSAIAAVPGSGPVRGVFTYNGDVYAVRDNAGATAAVLHKATTSGWAAQSFGHTLDFDAGTAEFVEGDTLTGGSSGATATIERVVLQSGTYGGSDADGYLVLSGLSGTFQNNEAITSSGGAATADGTAVAITWAPGGTYRAIEHNFYGSSDLNRAYIVSGTHRAMEWDGTVMAPIRTGLSASLDKPAFVAVMREHLFLAVAGGSILFSGTGKPVSFSTTDGAGEIALGETLTGLKSQNKGAMIITSRGKVAYLTGNDSTDFQLSVITDDSGAVENTLEVVGKPYFLDDIGVRDMQAAQSFGDWNIGTITTLIEPLIRQKRDNGVAVIGVQKVRRKDQMRLWYADGTGISIYLGRKMPEAMPFSVGFTPAAIHSGEDPDGYEILFAGDDAGFVYEIDSGASYDGAQVEAYLRLAFLHQGAPSDFKRYHRAFLDMITAEASSMIAFSSDYSFGSVDLPAGSEMSETIYGGGGFWDTAFWNQFSWSASVQSDATIELNGIGRNVSIVIMSDMTHEQPYTLSSITINFTPRRRRR